ncbi:MAG TPA: hypothetical protein VK129_09640, partial [Terriglobales bacterium]|nr:hypothetical protein [Terriglobales bacterium]
MTSSDVSADTQTQTSGAPPAADSRRKVLLKIVLVAFLLRLAVLTLGHTYHFAAKDDHFGFGWETGRIARSIALGKGFSSPMQGDTGPTAWIAPL